MKEITFEGATLAQAKQRAADWIKSQRGIKVTNSRVLVARSGGVRRGETANPNTRTVIVEYEDDPSEDDPAR
jgi:hypothetical protein